MVSTARQRRWPSNGFTEKDGARMNIKSFIAVRIHEVYISWTRAHTSYFLITLGYLFQTNMKFIAIIGLLVVVGSEAFVPGVLTTHTSTGE